jgi:hypothetical protein
MKTSLHLLALASALILSGCATAEREAARKAKFNAEWEAKFTDRAVRIHSAPSGAMIDLNGDVVGVTPCNLELKRCYQGSWPLNGNVVQILRARWLDGTVQEQHFFTTATPPQQVAYLHPHAQNYMRQALPTLSQN